MWIAALRGHYEVVKILISHSKVDINGKDMHGISVLWAACQGKHHEIVKLLLNPAQYDSHSNFADDSLATYQYKVYGNQQLMLRMNYFSVITSDDKLLCPNSNRNKVVADLLFQQKWIINS